MTEHVYKKIELVGSSTVSSDEAVKNAVKRAAATLRNLDWFEVVETRGQVENGAVKYWQVVVQVGMRLED